MNTYSNVNWPNYLTSQIPTNTRIGTLDKDSGSRQERGSLDTCFLKAVEL
jgi:hypothetical protein